MTARHASPDRVPIPVLALTCLLAVLATGASGDASASPRSAPGDAARPSPSVGKIGLLPPSVLVFDDPDGASPKPVPDVTGSAAAAEAVGDAFVAVMAAKGIEPILVGEAEVGPVDLSPLYALADRIARGDGTPLPEAAMKVEYPPGSVEKVLERHGLDAVWVVTGVVLPIRGSAGAAGANGPPPKNDAPGRRVLLRAALADRQRKVLFSDVVDEIVPDPAGLRGPEVARREVAALLAEYRTEPQKREAEEAAARAQAARAAAPRTPHPPEFRLGLGAGFLAPNGVDVHAGFLPRNSRWQYGYRYVRWREDFDDPVTGGELTQTTETMEGPQVNYLFRPQKRGTWYVGGSVLRWSKTEVSTVTGASDSADTVSLYVGGGYVYRFGKHFYGNAAAFLGPWADLKTDTGVSSEESSGGFDIQLQLGVSF